MYELRWNKAHTKVRVWSTIVDGYVQSKYLEPEKMKFHPDQHIRDLVLIQIYKTCPCCFQKLPRIVKKGVSIHGR